MSTTFCKACSGIFQGHYVPSNVLSEKDMVDVQDTDFGIPGFTKDVTEWKVRLEYATGQDKPTPYFHHSLHDLAKNADKCSLCAVMSERIQSDKQPAAIPQRLKEMKEMGKNIIGIPIIKPKPGTFCGMFTLGFLYVTWSGQKWQGHTFQIYQDFLTVDTSKADNRFIWKPKYDRQESLLRIKNWLSSSSTISRLTPRLPTRLLHCRPSANPGRDPRVKLVNTVGFDVSTRYIALSHRWGAVQPLMLLESLRDTFSKNIPFDTIPPTFQDAIRLANALDVEYIWIDSLCIIQDSKDDWQTEAAQMASIYSLSYVTISATAAQDSAAGLREQHPMLKHPCEVIPSWTGFGNQIPPVPVRIVNRSAFCDAVLAQPLFRRGWVFQEWILSPRTIHVARDQLWWTSASDMTSEGFAANETCEGFDFDVHREYIHTMAPGTLYSMESQSEESLQLVWHTLLQEYMSRSLTFESDRLVAFAGIASFYQSHAKIKANSYLAGIWRHVLLQDLLWTISEGRKVSPPQNYRAPSWSWASVEPAPDTKKKFLIGSQEINIKLSETEQPWVCTATAIEASVAITGSEFGSVSGGYIVLQGPLIKARLSMNMIDLSNRLTEEQALEFVPGGKLRFVQNRVTVPGGPTVATMGAYTHMSATRALLDDVIPTVLAEEVADIYLSVLYCRFNRDGSPIGQALVLVRGIEKGEFRRIGQVGMTGEAIEPWAENRDFSKFAPLTDEEEFLSMGNRPGIYNYRIV
ncbi:related to tol protein [Fusarium fujikuroi]|nr:related to tol protein [Fusarium fujikuroi]SCN77590.1 related to tol protein [Fusarium fujikuroi]SCN86641.1 related to tol protein [Fusarium fujikuroi]SCO31468.1 related to tol protein [Fusarium fujikuroi]SCV43451.1 related to tol protein [Fusarium fujikuroi]